MTPIEIGFWRPFKGGSSEIITEPSSGILDMACNDLANTRAGAHVSRYVSPAQLAGRFREDFFQDQVDRETLEAARLFALPVPRPDTLTGDAAESLASWLDGGVVAANYRGSSRCRICGEQNGTEELERDGYRYPSGLAHYVRDHRVAVPGLDR